MILIVLLAVFGSLLAALLPVGLGVAAVIVTGAAVYFLSLAMTMSVFVTNIASMLGIGVAVDYSLFMLSRYREEMQAGRDRAQALDVAMRTSGATVVFSGMTVMVSLAGLFLIDSTVDAVAGDRRDGGRRDRRARGGDAAAGADRAARPPRGRAGARREPTGALLRRVGDGRADRRVELLGALDGARDAPARCSRPRRGGVLLVLAIPALSLDYGNGALRQFPEDHEMRRGAELAAQVAGPASPSPLLIVVDAAGPTRDQAALDALRARAAGTRRGPVEGRTVTEDGERRAAPRRAARRIRRAPRRSRWSTGCAPRQQPRRVATSTSAARPPRRWTSTGWSPAGSGRSSCS